MDEHPGSALYPFHRCKVLHVVRHAQALHNDKENRGTYTPEQLYDPPLTPFGWNQVDNLRNHIQASGLCNKVELIVTSPFLRTLQTAVGIFGGDNSQDETNCPPLMVANAGNSNRPAISSLHCPPVIAVENCRESLSGYPPDTRRCISDCQKLFPAVDFSLIENDEDVLWKAGITEPEEETVNRGRKFFDWLWTRKEREIAIVSHGAYLFLTLKWYGKDFHHVLKEEVTKRFVNCEMRSMVFVDRSAIGSDPNSTNYSGNIPPNC